MKVKFTEKAITQHNALPLHIQKKARKQFQYLLEDFRHPSLNAKKYGGVDNVLQGRIDTSWRFYFHIVEPNYVMISIINHPK